MARHLRPSLQRLAQSLVSDAHNLPAAADGSRPVPAPADEHIAAAAALAAQSDPHHRISLRIVAAFHDVCNDDLRALLAVFRTDLLAAAHPLRLSPAHLDAAARHVQQYATAAIEHLAPHLVHAMWATRLPPPTRGRLSSDQLFQAFRETFTAYIQHEVIAELLDTARRTSNEPASYGSAATGIDEYDPEASWSPRERDLRPRATHPRQAVELLQIAFHLSPHSSPAEQQVLGELTNLRRGQVTAWLQNKRHRSHPSVKGKHAASASRDENELEENDQLVERYKLIQESSGRKRMGDRQPNRSLVVPGTMLHTTSADVGPATGKRLQYPSTYEPSTPGSRMWSPPPLWEQAASTLGPAPQELPSAELAAPSAPFQAPVPAPQSVPSFPEPAPQVFPSLRQRESYCVPPFLAMNQAVVPESKPEQNPGPELEHESKPKPEPEAESEPKPKAEPESEPELQPASLAIPPTGQAQETANVWAFQDEALAWRYPFPAGGGTAMLPPTIPPAACSMAMPAASKAPGAAMTTPMPMPLSNNMVPPDFLTPTTILPLDHSGLQRQTRSSLAAAGMADQSAEPSISPRGT